ncbi:MAG TPA: arginase family protein, partial [Pyrinomonadaceae bacterium]
MPYDSAHRNVRMGAGPEHFAHHNVVQTLTDFGHDVSIESVEAQSSFQAEIKTAFELHGLLAERVSSAYSKETFPLILSGNCNSILGTVAGVGSEDLGVIWFDSHGDFNTPETTESGFLDGMGLATVAGLCWKRMATSIPGFKPISGGNMLHVGGRDWYPAEKGLFEKAGGMICGAEPIRQQGAEAGLAPTLDQLRSRVSRIYLHFDLDVLDPAVACAN